MSEKFKGVWRWGRYLLLASCILPVQAWAESLPTPYWSTSTTLSSDDGYADLVWGVSGGGGVSFFRLTERFAGESSVHFVDHPTTRLYRIEPGLYEFRVQACQRDAAGYPDCGDMSSSLELTVTDAVEDHTISPPKKGKRPREETPGPGAFSPGRWHNPAREGHGWTFFWKNGLSYPVGSPFHGDAWDLFGSWYTYEVRSSDPQNLPDCPAGANEDHCDYRPAYAQLLFSHVSAQQAVGTVYLRRSGTNINVGSVSVDFEGPGSATIQWDAHFQFEHLQGTDAIEMLVAPDPDPMDNPAHYSGYWYQPGQNWFVSHALGIYSEAVEVLFDDQHGNPSWILAAGDDPVPTHTDLCFFYVAEGFAPGTTGEMEFHEDGCDSDQPASSTNRNGAREFTDFEEELFWANISLPGGSAPEGFVTGSPTFPKVLDKGLHFHRISYDSPVGAICDADSEPGGCSVALTWFTDGNFPLTSAFAHETGSGERTLVATQSVAESHVWTAGSAGEFVFELRMGDTADSTLMAVSERFTVVGDAGPPPPPGDGDPETPPAPGGPPNMSPTVASSQTGATGGQFAVLPTGSATYRVPIRVAPGSGGLAPSVALVYDSQAGNGPVGVGWQIDGFSVISRCAQTIEQDGDPEVQRITFTAQDRFCLDGERLMAIDGAYGANGTEYRKEIDDYTRVVSYGSGADGPQYFKAWSRDGVVVEFGGTPDSRIETRVPGIENVAYAWAQNRLEDTAGNFIRYEYSERDAGAVDFVLDRIRYTGNVHAGTQPYAELRFYYQQGREDDGLAYTAGVGASHSRLLGRVDSLSRVDAGSTLQFLRSYSLDYGADGWGRAALESLTECRDSTQAVCFPSTNFTWLKSEHAISDGGPGVADLFTQDFRGLALGDTSGDGRADLLITERDGQQFEFGIAQGSPSGNFSIGTERFGLPEGDDAGVPVRLTVIDLNADGYQDVVYVRRSAGTVNWYARLAGPDGMGTEFVILENCCNLLSPSLLQVMDYDGDGLSDIMTHRPDHQFEEASEIVVLINDFQPGDAQPGFRQARVIDVNYPDLFPAITANGWEVADEVPSIAFQSGGSALGRVDDFYGDGTADILVRLSRLYRRCMNPPCQPDGPGASEPPEHSTFNFGGSEPVLNSRPGGPDPAEEWAQATFYLVFFADQEGHYSTYEIIAKGADDDCGVPDICNAYYELPDAQRTQPADINADGLADVAYLDAQGAWYYRVNTGNAFLVPQLAGQLPGDERAEQARFVDLNGDRYPELIYPDLLNHDEATWMVQFNNLGHGFAAPQPSTVPVGNPAFGDAAILVDFTSDGIVDELFIDWRSDGQGAEPTTTRVHRGINWITGQGGQAVNAVKAVENGLGARTEIEYGPLTDAEIHTRMHDSANANWGGGSVVYDLAAPYYVVANVAQSAPTFASSQGRSERSYHYVGAKLQAGGRGFLGFAEIVEWDAQNQIRTNTRYRQDFPLLGRVSDRSRFVSNVNDQFDIITDISENSPIEWPNVGASTSVPQHNANGTIIRYEIHEYSTVETATGAHTFSVLSTADLTRDFTLQGAFREKALVSRSFDDFGNIITGREYHYANDGILPWSRVTTTSDWINDLQSWRLGRLKTKQVMHWRGNAATSITRESAYAYHPTSDLLTRETAEPGDPIHEVVTEYALDDFGNRSATTITGVGMAPRETARTYDELGRFVVELRNAYGQVSEVTEEWDVFGNPIETYNIDGVRTDRAADHMGRPFVSFTETGAWQRTELGMGGHPQCPAGTDYHSVTTGGGLPASVECLDRLGRIKRSASEGFLGSWIYTDSYFDASGRPERVSEPYFQGDSRYWNVTQYDALGRVSHTTAANGLVEEVFYDHQANHCGANGPRTSLTRSHPGDGTIRDRLEQQNVAGETTRVFDDQCGGVSYAYDAVGNLVQTVGIDGAAIAIEYDPLGLYKVQMHDPDKGFWQYASNALGEVTRQLDGKAQAIDFEYDLMGRIIERRELSAVGSLDDDLVVVENFETRDWQNSTAQGVTGRGRIASEGYWEGSSGTLLHQRTYHYDDFGRVAQVDHQLEAGQFTERTTYDAFGRVFQQFDASGTSHGVRFGYNPRGYVESIREARDGGDGVVYQQVEAMDARGNPIAVTLGNGVEVFADYDPASGLVQTLEAYEAGGQQMQFVEYAFDRLGNLESRHDRSGTNDLLEEFDYDLLDRLERVLLTAPQQGLIQEETQSMIYDDAGNIAFRQGVGGYSYGSGDAGPHAVTQAGPVTYLYDVNGNQVSSSNGRSIEYSVFDKATRISRDGNVTEFSYGLGNRRYKRVDGNGVDGQKTTWAVGNVEWIEQGSSTRFKRYIAGVAIVDYYPNSGETDAWYLTRDHLESTHSISNADGEKVGESHFGAWGVRQGADWQSPLAGGGLIAVNEFTTRGFTGHEHADALGVIHMNGRIYDPRLGRFLQADPFVQAPRNGQTLNRYSYALNNPLSYTDPSGYFLKRLIRKWGRVIVAATAAYFTYGIASSWSFAGMLNAAGGLAGTANVGALLTASGLIGGATAGIVSGALVSGTLKGAVKGAFTGALAAGVAQYFGDKYTISRISVDGIVGGVTERVYGGDFKDGLLKYALISSATLLTFRLKRFETAHSRQTPGQIGESPGYRGVSGKTGGGRLNQNKFREVLELARVKNWTYEEALEFYFDTVKPSPLGCHQGGPGCIFQIPYGPGGLIDYVVEGFSGVHDWLNHPIWYNADGTSKTLIGWKEIYGRFRNATNVLFAAPVVAPALVPDFLRPLIFSHDGWQ